jgi:hypothetical protein
MSLRARANDEGDLMAKCFEQSHQAHSGHDDSQARMLSDQGHEHQKKMEDLNKEASDWIFIGIEISRLCVLFRKLMPSLIWLMKRTTRSVSVLPVKNLMRRR